MINNKKRIIVLDTETTGMNNFGKPFINHRIIEIGAVEIINRRFTGNNFHVYIQPNRLIDSNALKVHGITNDFLSDKPLFKNIAKKFFQYIQDSKLVIHNAPFDVGFINQEFSLLKNKIIDISNFCCIIDTLKISRKLFPGKKNTLDALCNRYKIKNSHRVLHGALLDAFLLGKLYLLMTSGQESMSFYNNIENTKSLESCGKLIINKKKSLKILKANNQELKLHEKYVNYIKNKKLIYKY
ncbi:DNA polymerase III subunit epsilon [Buchnera aphidicola (Aphis craccivora)]|uniref:DNA polymerase III subunit epsilon n=1 Tax=Buchnera aphidicola (Aphis craccivora) TaxID=466616 RepID=A0A4D6XNF7_9GAMM|nr:DNA polymerase III subunit epsilon [Buchnera aphidicola]QCI16498.1 DNA polymerase III subunit epsilon [Buchnera aphidicola (Aphis craccivora)]QLL40635.1 DNA polymerase III subunit epsilon [Buchnera aphidicola (Aphis craccivore)]WAI18009.1 MAG: DNA polymerase III subunit epsilon [Buchnera aphidicola (Aphis craccivora)]